MTKPGLFSSILISVSALSLIILASCATHKSRQVASAPPTLSEDDTTIDGPWCRRAVIGDKELPSMHCEYLAKTPFGAKSINYLKLEGDSVSDINYAHGLLMAKNIEQGVLKGAVSIADNTIKRNSALKAQVMQTLYNCLASSIKNSVSSEFINSTQAMWRGYRDGIKALNQKPMYSQLQAIDAAVGIELGNVAEGLMRKVAELREESSSSAANVRSIAGHCAATLPQNLIFGVLNRLGSLFPKLGGCIGFSVPWNLTQTDLGPMHARNLDIDMVGDWNLAPTFALVHVRGKNKFFASFGAGLVVPGGVGGMNEKGLAVSLHQMSTTHYKSFIPDRQGLTAPELAQKILLEANNLADAIRIAKAAKHFAAWTLLITDSQCANTTDSCSQAAAIEFSGEKISVRPVEINKPMGQTNHFIANEMKDQAFTYNFNKYFESFSRLAYIEERMASLHRGKRADVQWMIDSLAGHQEVVKDPETPYRALRAFGRTSVKAYNVMSVVMLPQVHQYWATLADRLPAAHSTFVGFNIDFTKNEVELIGALRTHLYEQIPNWEASLQHYVNARKAFMHNLDNQPEIAWRELSTAIELAGKDKVDGQAIEELPYYFMRARVQHDLALRSKDPTRRTRWLKGAARDWQFLWERRERLFIYGQALTAAYSVATQDQLGLKSDDREQRLNIAKEILSRLSRKYDHFDLQDKIKFVDALKIRNSEFKNPDDLPPLDFVVVEQ